MDLTAQTVKPEPRKGRQMSSIVIAGGGFAAVWSAAAAARERLQAGLSPDELPITVVSPRDDMVVRPRLYEPDPAQMSVPLARLLTPIGVDHLRGTVEGIDSTRGNVTVRLSPGPERRLDFGRLVVSTGSQLVGPPTSIRGVDMFHDVDTIEAAVALDRHLHSLRAGAVDAGTYTVVVVGAGFVGLEVATELVTRLRALAPTDDTRVSPRVVLLERESSVGPELGPGPRPVILSALSELGVELRLETSLTGFDGSTVSLSDGTGIPAHTVVWTAGIRAQALTERVAGDRDRLGRLVVGADMRVPTSPSIFAAGDSACVEVEPGRHAPQSCQYAHQLGKIAGRNAVADLTGRPGVQLVPDPYVTCLDLGAAGAVYTTGYERTVQATGEAGKVVKRMVNTELIYPPLDDADLILSQAVPEFESRPIQPSVA
jgi:NADH:ubiquinone reductase (H+-translocating)